MRGVLTCRVRLLPECALKWDAQLASMLLIVVPPVAPLARVARRGVGGGNAHGGLGWGWSARRVRLCPGVGPGDNAGEEAPEGKRGAEETFDALKQRLDRLEAARERVSDRPYLLRLGEEEREEVGSRVVGGTLDLFAVFGVNSDRFLVGAGVVLAFAACLALALKARGLI